MSEFDLTKLVSAIQHVLFDERLYFGKETGVWDTDTANAYHGWCLRNNVAPYMARQQPTSLATTEPNLARLISAKVNVSLASKSVNPAPITPTVAPAPAPEPVISEPESATEIVPVIIAEPETDSDVTEDGPETQNPSHRFKKHRR
jgi:hypothetical protein